MNIVHTKFQDVHVVWEIYYRLKNVKKTSFGLHTLLDVARVGLEWMEVSESTV